MTRRWPRPPVDRTIHLVGDIQSVNATRRGIVLADLERDTVPDVAHRLQVGDFTNTGLSGDFTTMRAFMDGMGSGTWLAAVGNHDRDAGLTASQAATAIGMPSENFSVDGGYAVFVIFYTRAWIANDPATPPDVTWLAAELDKFPDRTVFVVTHPNLVGTTGASEMASADDALIRPVLEDHPCVKAWICGHSHHPIHHIGMVSPLTIGGHTVVAIDCGAMLYTGLSVEWTDELWSPYLTVYDDKLEIRFRDHAAHQWVGGSSENKRLFTVDL